MSIKTKTISVFLSVATALWLSGAAAPIAASAAALTQAQIDSIVSLLQSFGADQTTIDNVKTSLSGGTPSGTAGASGTYVFSVNLKAGSTGTDVKNLQIVLNKDAATQVAASGAGSPGNETTYFGPATKAAVIKFQNKYVADVLTPVGLTAGTGYVGPTTRAKLNALYGDGGTTTGGTTTGGTTTGGTTTVAPQGKGLTVTLNASQPAATIVPYGASRIPFTKVDFTASSDGDVTVNSIVVERTGLAADAAINEILLLDETGAQVGLAKTLNSVHQVTLNEPFTVKAGQTKTMTLAVNRPSTAGAHGGEIAYMTLVSVNTSATVNGTLPISGTGQTINETLAIGSVTMARGPLDPNASTTSKEVGATGFIFSSVKVTAGSAEKVLLKSIRWYQSGSAGAADLANVKTYVDSTAYDTSVSSDGKYYTSTFGSGILIDKGFSKEIYVKGDIAGGSARSIQFDIYKTTDLFLVGDTYGYGITPPTSTAVSGFHATNPWYYAFSVTISAGTMNVTKATSVDAQNIAINLANQPLGGFTVDVKGEAISVAAMTFRLSEWKGTGTTYTQDVTNISMFDENGSVVAGPVDVTASSPNVAFSDTVTFPVGVHVYTLKGKITTDYANNATIAASTTPASDWTTVKGVNTGVTITPSGGTITGNTMTIKSGSLAVNVSSLPLAQTVIAGAAGFTFSNIVLDAGGSGENASINSIPMEFNASANPTRLSSCKLYDGSTLLTSGSNIKNPSAAASSTAFTLDAPLTITKGTAKTIALKCDIAGNATANDFYYWGCNNTTCSGNYSATGAVSGQSITPSVTLGAGQIMTIASAGSYTVADDSTPGYTVVSSGTTGVTLLKLKFTASNEDIDIYRANFALSPSYGNGSGSSTALDLVNRTLTLYDAAAPTVVIGTAQFSVGRFATSTLFAAGAFRVPSGGSKTMLVKGDIAAVSYTVGPLQQSGDLLQIAYDASVVGTGSNGEYGKGVSSGTTINGPTPVSATSTGVRIFKAYPSFAKIDLSTSERLLQTGSGRTFYKFSMTANGGDVYVYRWSFDIASSTQTATSTNYGLYAYTDSAFSQADSSFTTNGLINFGSCWNGWNAASSTNISGSLWSSSYSPVRIYPDKTACNTATTTYKIPSGTTRYFKLTATVYNVISSVTATENISVDLAGDAAFPISLCAAGNSCNTTMGQAANIKANDTNADFIWSPNSTTSSVTLSDLDYTNGYGLPGLPTDNTAIEIIQNK